MASPAHIAPAAAALDSDAAIGNGAAEAKVQRDRRRADAADRDLTFGADVDDAGAKAQRDAAAGEQIGRGAVERAPI